MMPVDLSKTSRETIDEASLVLEPSGVITPPSFLLPLSVFAVVSLLLMLLAPEAPWSIRLLIIALTLVTLKRWGGVMVLLLVQADLCLRESQRLSTLSGSAGIVFVLAVLLVLMFVARQRHSLQQISRSSIFRLGRNSLASSQPRQSRPGSIAVSSVIERSLASAVRGLALLLCCILAAEILLTLIPQDREMTENLRDLINADPSITAGAIMLVAIVAFWIVASEISWRQMTPSQARVYLRSSFLKIHYRDLRMIVIRRLKLRTKKIAAAKSRRNTSETVSGPGN